MIERYFLGLLTFGLPNNVTRFSNLKDRSGPRVLTKEEVERISAKLTYELENKYEIFITFGINALAVGVGVAVVAAAVAGIPVLVTYAAAVLAEANAAFIASCTAGFLAKYVPAWLKHKLEKKQGFPEFPELDF
jgi:hypothetical protein